MNNFGVAILLDKERTNSIFQSRMKESRTGYDNLVHQIQTGVKKDQECSIGDIVSVDIQSALVNYEHLIKEQEFRKQMFNKIHLLSKHQDLEEEERLLNEIEKLEAKRCWLENEIQDRHSSLKKFEEGKDAKLSQINKLLNLFSILGFDIIHADGCLQLLFSCINSSDSNRIYKLVIKIVNNVFQVAVCEPVVNTIDQLITDLNETRNFRRFVINLRKEFCRVANLN